MSDTSGDRGRGRGVRRLLYRWVARPIVLLITIFLTLILARAFGARKKPELQAWQRTIPAGEFTAADLRDGFTFAQYLTLEDGLFAGLDRYDLPGSGERGMHRSLLRYAPDSPQNPANHARDWNRSYELVPDDPRGGVLLLHGLTDSPYSMRGVADVLFEQGYHVLVMRMPGHGTVPAGLLEIEWEDWAAAVEVGARHVAERVGPSRPFFVGGYSNGGALSLHHALAALDDETLRAPDRLFLFSPAVGVTAFARVARWDRLYGFIPYFEKSKWLDILPEYDPYKYNSFPLNAGTQESDLTRVIQARLAKLDEQGRTGELPPILTFQSVVDATVLVSALIEKLYARLEPNGSELVLFDLNRCDQTDEFIDPDHRRWIDRLGQDESLDYRFTVVTNMDDEAAGVMASSKPPRSQSFQDTPLDLVWPPQVYSLAHVAIPFPADDSIYGLDPTRPAEFGMHLGMLAPRGERGVLEVPASTLTRIRCNPFFDYIARRITEVVDAGSSGNQ